MNWIMAAPNAPRDERYEITPEMPLPEKLELARMIAFDIIHAAVNLRSRQWMTIRVKVSNCEDQSEDHSQGE